MSEKPKKKRKKYRQRMQPKQMSLYNCFEGAFNEITQLRDEMEENVDNLQEHFMETQRYMDTEEALNALDEKVEQYFVDWEEYLKTIDKDFMDEMHTVNQYTWLKRRGLARWRRLANCSVALDYGKSRLEDFLDSTELDRVPVPTIEAMKALIEMCDNIDDLDNIEWPRMYG